MSWLDELDLSNLEPNEHEGFKQVMGCYKTTTDALIGSYNAKKMVGEPYRFPKDVTKLSPQQQKDFNEKVKSYVSVEEPLTEDSIKELNFAKGLDTTEVDEESKKELAKLFVDKKFSLAKAQDMIEHLNKTGKKFLDKLKTEQQNEIKAALENSNKKLDTYFGSDKRKTLAEQLRRAINNDLGLSKEEIEDLADDMTDDGYIFRKPALAKVLLERIAPLAKEGNTDIKNGNQTPKSQTLAQKLASEGFDKTANLIPAFSH